MDAASVLYSYHGWEAPETDEMTNSAPTLLYRFAGNGLDRRVDPF
jgi:hypothetical protein